MSDFNWNFQKPVDWIKICLRMVEKDQLFSINRLFQSFNLQFLYFNWLFQSFILLNFFFDLFIKNSSKIDQKWSIWINYRSKLWSTIQFCCWNLNWTEIEDQIWTAWNPNGQRFDSGGISFSLTTKCVQSVQNLNPFGFWCSTVAWFKAQI